MSSRNEFAFGSHYNERGSTTTKNAYYPPPTTTPLKLAKVDTLRGSKLLQKSPSENIESPGLGHETIGDEYVPQSNNNLQVRINR